MEDKNAIEMFKQNFLERIRTAYCKRKNFKTKCFNAFINEKTKIEKSGYL